MVTIKDRTTAEFPMDAETRRDFARVDLNAPMDRPDFPKKMFLRAMEGRKGGASFTPAAGGVKASPVWSKVAGVKAGRPAAHGHSRHK